MQAVIAIPPRQTLLQFGAAEQALLQEVAGTPLLVRVIATAMRGGVDSLLVIWPDDVDPSIWERCAASRPLRGLKRYKLFRSSMFDPRSTDTWAAIATSLEDRFVWLPWSWITHKRALAGLPSIPVRPSNWDYPTLIEKRAVLYGSRVRVMPGRAVDGVPITSRADVARAERFLVGHSGKPTDGMYSKFNRLLCRPAVRLLTHTPVTPNQVTVAGLVVAIVAALVFARGSYLNYVGGALLFFLSGLVDEIDGMLARIKFMESSFGTWFEGFVDNATYLLVFSGITAGLYRQRGSHEQFYGLALLIGCLLSFIVIALQRKTATAADRPHEYSGRMNQLMDSDSSNWISFITRQVHVFIKKGVAIHYLLIFTLAGGLPLFLRLAAFGSNLTWVLTLYFNHRFFRRQHIAGIEKTIQNAA